MNTKNLKRHQLAAAVLLSLASAFAFAQVANPPTACQDATGNTSGSVGPEANNFACGPNSTASGGNSTATGANATGAGLNATATGADSLAGVNGTATGQGAFATGPNSTATGQGAQATAINTTAQGAQSIASADHSAAFGAFSEAHGLESTVAGTFARVNAGTTGAGAFGFGSIGDRSNAISFGNSEALRQLIYVAAGTEDTDAVNVAQLRQIMQAFGGGASFEGGIYGAPSYAFTSGGIFDNVGDALLYLDGRITRISLTPGPQGPAGPQGPQGPAGQGGADCNTAVCYDDSTRTTATLNNGGSATRLRNVDAGIDATDAVNLGQMEAGDRNTLNQANSYTDSRMSNILSVVDDRFEAIEGKLTRMGAMNSAMSMMTASAAGVQSANKVAVGVGFDSGETAIAAGYQKVFRSGAVMTFGASYSGGDTSAGVGVGFGF